MKAKKEQLLAIKKLNLAGVLERMTEEQVAEYCEELDKFIDSFPAQESKLRLSLEKRDIDAFSRELLNLLSGLSKIHANDLSQTSFQLLQEFRNGNYEKAESYLSSFVVSISELSIDIQMAQYREVNGAPRTISPVPQSTENMHVIQKSILAVDDASFLLAMLKLALQDTDYKFTGVTSGDAALKFLINHRPDLFILDIEMPGMNGYELAKKIREIGQKAPIVFLTGNSKKEYVLKAVQAGAADFIVKPVDKEQVLGKIKKFIG